MYRLITRGTLEEKIMGLQKFKMSIANTVISQENASLQSMGTDQLLNLFTLDKVRAQSREQLRPLVFVLLLLISNNSQIFICSPLTHARIFPLCLAELPFL